MLVRFSDETKVREDLSGGADSSAGFERLFWKKSKLFFFQMIDYEFVMSRNLVRKQLLFKKRLADSRVNANDQVQMPSGS